MKTPTSTHLSHLAVAVSLAINLLLIGALRAGFDVPSADNQVVQLPSVTVVGKRLSTQDDVVALTAKPLTSSADVKL